MYRVFQVLFKEFYRKCSEILKETIIGIKNYMIRLKDHKFANKNTFIQQSPDPLSICKNKHRINA